MEWFIPYNVPSSKNSKQFVRTPKGPRLVHSKVTARYIKNTEDYYWALGFDFRKKMKGRKPPYKVQFQFIRDTKRKFDYINAAQIVQDLMVKHNWIQDDNCDFLLPAFLPYIVDKDNCGVKIIIS
jgi:hypothetical protein